MGDKELLEQAFDAFEKGENLFLTGGAGVGKSYTLHKIIDELEKKNKKFAVTALTGMASLQIPYATTVHRAFGLGIKSNPEEYIDVITGTFFPYHFVKSLEVLIIDEISMMRSDLFQLLHTVLSAVKDNEAPFGGVQLILSGDFLQIPPVIKKHENLETPWAFQTDLWEQLDLNYIYLKEIKRQDDAVLQKALNKVRLGEVTGNVKKFFDQTKFNRVVDPVKLMSTNASVDKYNRQKLEKIEGEKLLLKGRVDAVKEKFEKQIQKECLSPVNLELKEGARVMMTVNDPEDRFVNGSLGEFLGTDGKYLRVKILSTETEVSVDKSIWYLRGAKGKVLASLTQYPMRLAYAITIHKSQGMSIDCLDVDLENCFAQGMAYVALSRAKSYEGLVVRNFKKSCVKCSDEAIEFYKKLEEA
jgi:ATP-dependent exoDNAse (exonuclease V) alpha subunit